jgi:spore coat protein A
MKFTRRQILKGGLIAGVGLMLPWKFKIPQALAQIPGGTLAPGDVDKYVLPLVKPPAMPGTSLRNMDQYMIGVRQRILSPPHPMTTVWSYGDVRKRKHMFDGGTFNYPAFTIEANWNRTVQVI